MTGVLPSPRWLEDLDSGSGLGSGSDSDFDSDSGLELDWGSDSDSGFDHKTVSSLKSPSGNSPMLDLAVILSAWMISLITLADTHEHRSPSTTRYFYL